MQKNKNGDKETKKVLSNHYISNDNFFCQNKCVTIEMSHSEHYKELETRQIERVTKLAITTQIIRKFFFVSQITNSNKLRKKCRINLQEYNETNEKCLSYTSIETKLNFSPTQQFY
jgi:hypothetical protein